MNKCFRHKGMQKVNCHLENCIISLEVEEMQMRTELKDSAQLEVVSPAAPQSEEVPARSVLGALLTLFHLFSNTVS